jgi:putative endonuclease
LLVYFEFSEDINPAINWEKHIKAGPRKKKLVLIDASNPSWRDLYPDLL